MATITALRGFDSFSLGGLRWRLASATPTEISLTGLNGATATVVGSGFARGSAGPMGIATGASFGDGAGAIATISGARFDLASIAASGGWRMLPALLLAGHDTITGSDAADVLGGQAGNDAISGNAGDDVLVGGWGNDRLTGGDGSDTARFDAGFGVRVDLGLTTAQNTGEGLDTLSGIEHLVGSRGSDLLVGSAAGNRLDGGRGNDTLDGGAGDDTLVGGAGRDTARFDGAVAVTVDLGQAGPQDTGQGSDVLELIENLAGSAAGDRLTGDAGGNHLDGRAGNDTLSGGAGEDRLLGGDGDDRLDGGAGRDVMNGGAGADVFVFSALADSPAGDGDVVAGFVSGVDTLDLTALTAAAGGIWDVSFATVARNTLVRFDAGNDGSVDLEVFLRGTQAITMDDLAL